MDKDAFTAEQMKALHTLADSADQLIKMHENYQRANWLGRLLWKLAIVVGATVAGVAAFKENVLSILKGG